MPLAGSLVSFELSIFDYSKVAKKSGVIETCFETTFQLFENKTDSRTTWLQSLGIKNLLKDLRTPCHNAKSHAALKLFGIFVKIEANALIADTFKLQNLIRA